MLSKKPFMNTKKFENHSDENHEPAYVRVNNVNGSM